MSQILDATGAAFFARQLEYVKAKTYDVQYQDLLYRMLFPVSTETPAGATTITFRTYDKAGMAKIINTYAKDLPRVDIAGKETTIPVRTLADAFGYSRKEILGAQMTGTPLDQKRANAARRAIEELMNEICWFGDVASGLPGFLSNPNIPVGNVPNGTGGNEEWTTKTPDEILFDVNEIFSYIFETTLQKERANVLLLPTKQWSLIMATPRSANSDTTIAQYVVNNSPFLSSLNDIISVPELKGAGVQQVTPGDTDRMVAYTKSPDKLEMEIPEDILFHPQQEKGLEFEIPVSAEFGGINVYYPLSACFRDRI